MKTRFFNTYVLALVASSVFCQTQTCLENLNHPGYQSITQVTDTDTIVREYILYVPANYNEDEASPLVINLHGFGDCASDFAEATGDFYGYNDLADFRISTTRLAFLFRRCQASGNYFFHITD